MRTPPSVLPPDPSPGTGYQPTFLDRHGADGPIRLRSATYGVMVAALSFIVSMLEGAGHVVPIAVASAVAGYLTFKGSLWLTDRAARSALALVFPAGDHTPYLDQYSQVESIEARGDVAGALAAWERIIAEHPEAVVPRLRAAELYASRGASPARAAELFRDVRALDGVTQRDALYACSRLVDLYDGALDEPGRALVELRRIIELYPGTPVATHARDALPRMKARLLEAPATD